MVGWIRKLGERLSAWDDRSWKWVDDHAAWIALGFGLLNLALKWPHLAGASLFLDEGVAIYDTQGSLWDIVQFSASDPTPPLYYLVQGIWGKLFGISEGAARFPSMLFSCITAMLIFRLGQRHLGAKVGFFAAVFFSLSTVAMGFSHEARSYALASMLMVISYHLFLRILRNDRVRPAVWVGLIVANTLVLYTHYLTSMGIGAQALLSLWLLRGRIRAFVQYAGAQVAVLGLWLPWVMYNRSQLQPSKVTSWLQPPGWDEVRYVLQNLAGSYVLVWMALGLLAFGLILWVASGIRKEWSQDRLLPWSVVLGWFACSLGLQYMVARYFMPVFDLRYVMYALPGGLLLLAASVFYFRFPRLLQYAIAGTYIGFLLVVFDTNPPKQENWRSAVALVKSIHTDKSVVITLPYYQFMPFAYYYSPEAFRNHDETLGLLNAENVRFGNDTLLIPKIDGEKVHDVILVLSQESLSDPNETMLHYLSTRYCIARQGVFAGVRVFQFQNPPCLPPPGGHFVIDYGSVSNPEEADRLRVVSDSGSLDGRITFVDAEHQYSATQGWKVSEILGGHFSRSEITVRARLHDLTKRIIVVYEIVHASEGYLWIGSELQQVAKAGEWFEHTFEMAATPLKSADDDVKVYVWSPDGGSAEIDQITVDFWDGD